MADTTTGTIEPLDAYEAAALRRVLRELGQLGRYDEIAADFAKRGAKALEELPKVGILDAAEQFDAVYFQVVMSKSGHA